MHPVVLRICDPIEGIDDVLLAQHLGVGDLYKPKKVHTAPEEGEVPLCIQDNRYDNCHPFKFKCRNENCKSEIEIKTTITEFVSIFTKRIILVNYRKELMMLYYFIQGGVPRPSLAMCPNPACEMPPWRYAYAIQNRLQQEIRKFISQYYYGEVECENPICLKVMRRITMGTLGTFPKCYNCLDGNVHRIVRII